MRITYWLSTLLLTMTLAIDDSRVAHAGPVTLQNATATFSETVPNVFLVGEAFDGLFTTTNGWGIFEPDIFAPHGGTTNPQTAVFETAIDVGFSEGTLLTFTFYHEGSYHNLGRFRLSATTDSRSNFADGLATGGDVTANWMVLSPLTAVSAGGATMTILGDQSVLASGFHPENDVYTVTVLTSLTGITGFRLEVLADASLPTDGPGRADNGNFHLQEFQVDASPVPEPSSLLLLGLGAISILGGARWRGKRPC